MKINRCNSMVNATRFPRVHVWLLFLMLGLDTPTSLYLVSTALGSQGADMGVDRVSGFSVQVAVRSGS